MADLKPDRVRAAELAQTGAGRGRARGEQAEREHESTRTLFEHLDPSELAVVPSGMPPKNFVGIESRDNNGSLTSRAGTPDGRGRPPMPYMPTPRSSRPFPRGVPGRRRKRTSPPEQRATVFTRTETARIRAFCLVSATETAVSMEPLPVDLRPRHLSLPGSCLHGRPVP